MDKKKLTSWAVSFSSLALVAGMIGYLGITNKNTLGNTTAATAQTQIQQSTTQDSQSGNNLAFTQTADNRDQSFPGNNLFSHQHSNFDTTTGGS